MLGWTERFPLEPLRTHRSTVRCGSRIGIALPHDPPKMPRASPAHNPTCPTDAFKLTQKPPPVLTHSAGASQGITDDGLPPNHICRYVMLTPRTRSDIS